MEIKPRAMLIQKKELQVRQLILEIDDNSGVSIKGDPTFTVDEILSILLNTLHFLWFNNGEFEEE